MHAATPTRDTSVRTLAAVAALWLLTYFGARMAAEELQRGSFLQLVAVLLPVLPFALVLWLLVKAVRSADELERRINLEALAIAFPLSVLLLMVLGLLELVVDLNPADWSYRHIWPFMVMFWVVGLAFARRRYA